MNLAKEAYERAIQVLEKCSTKHGFYAAFPGYDMVFARDAMIISLGASLAEKKFKEVFKRSLITLAENQSAKGQIPNAVDNWSSRKKHIDYKSIDSTLWFIIGNYIYKERYKDSSMLKRHEKNIQKALTWLSYQDMGEDGMLEQLPTTDWQDAFPHRYGHTINTQALYYKVLNLTKKIKLAEELKEKVNNNKDDSLWNGEYYLSYKWKNHGKYKEQSNWFDSLGNLLAIIFNLADNNKADKILNYIKKEKIDEPCPIKAIYPPIEKNSRHWQNYFEDCEARTPYHYLNAGIWTFIGGFYVCALVKEKKFQEAEYQLKKLAEANLKYNFAEWLHGETGKLTSKFPEKEDNQGWNAGAYVLAYESLKNKKCLI